MNVDNSALTIKPVQQKKASRQRNQSALTNKTQTLSLSTALNAEPFVYNRTPTAAKKNTVVKETARQKLMSVKDTRSFGASIETLDFSDNELNDTHGLHIVSLIKSQGERRDSELWLSSLRRQAAEEHLQAKKNELNNQIAAMSQEGSREINSNFRIKNLLSNLEQAEH